jgi:4-hydroxybenzoate polyprenyltransferase/phosphoserine phosphatase
MHRVSKGLRAGMGDECTAPASARPIEANAALPEDGRPAKPLCVDLDGTLLRTDTLVEGLVSIFSGQAGAGRLSSLAATNRAAFKQRVAAAAQLTPETLPFNAELIEFLRGQKSAGRKLVLATGADQKTARAIADQVGLFDEVVASDGVRNLDGKEKAKELVRRFGHKGFDYAGGDRADLAVWGVADGIIIVNAPGNVARKARALGPVVAEFDNRQSVAAAAVRAMRPHQWTKNLLVFVPLLTSRSFTDWTGLLGAVGMFAGFCAMASAIYLINDLLDLTADRRHPRKRHRPFASGTLPIPLGMGLALVLMATGAALAANVGAVSLLAIYAAISLAYSLALKKYPLVDVFILAALYTLRIVAGGVASGHLVTLWLLAFSGFTFLSLALVKRTGEFVHLEPAPDHHGDSRRGYRSEDSAILTTFGVASAFSSSVVLALFVNSASAFQQYDSPEMLWALVPLILFWQLRLWLSTVRGYMHDDPIVYASADWVSWLVAVAVLAVVLLASFGVRVW